MVEGVVGMPQVYAYNIMGNMSGDILPSSDEIVGPTFSTHYLLEV